MNQKECWSCLCAQLQGFRAWKADIHLLSVDIVTLHSEEIKRQEDIVTGKKKLLILCIDDTQIGVTSIGLRSERWFKSKLGQ